MAFVPRPAVSQELPGETTFIPSQSQNLQPSHRSVYRISLIADGAVVSAAMAGILLPIAFSSKLVVPRCPCSATEVNALDRHVIGNHSDVADTASTITVNAAVLLPLILEYMDLGPSLTLAEDTVVYGETLAVTGAIATVTKYAIHRPRPRAYESPGGETVSSPANYLSFFSGHVSLAFSALTAGAVTLALRHGDRWWHWIVVGLVGTSVAVERVLAGQHFYSDVAAAALIGVGTGLLVPRLHRAGAETGPHLSILPVHSGAGLALTARF